MNYEDIPKKLLQKIRYEIMSQFKKNNRLVGEAEEYEWIDLVYKKSISSLEGRYVDYVITTLIKDELVRIDQLNDHKILVLTKTGYDHLYKVYLK